jgi:hypothetical protein
MPRSHQKPATDENQFNMFSLFQKRPRAIRKLSQQPSLEPDTLQAKLIALANHGFSRSEIARETNTPVSTVHFWAKHRTIPGFTQALSYGCKHGHSLRVIEALSNLQPQHWEQLETSTKLDANLLGRAINKLLSEKAIATKVYVRILGKLVRSKRNDGHDVINELRFYFLGPNTSNYLAHQDFNAFPNGSPPTKLRVMA